MRLGRSGWAFVLTAAGAFLVVATIFTSLFPRVMVSSTDFSNSLTVDDASSAHYTLKVMTVVALIVTPVVLLYQALDVPRLPRSASAATSRVEGADPSRRRAATVPQGIPQPDCGTSAGTARTLSARFGAAS